MTIESLHLRWTEFLTQDGLDNGDPSDSYRPEQSNSESLDIAATSLQSTQNNTNHLPGTIVQVNPTNTALENLGVDLPRNYDNYDVEEELGRGGMGIVYKARQKSLRRNVALKKVRSEQLLSPKQSAHPLNKFISEARVTGHLDHPNIVPVHNLYSNESGEPMLAMKQVGGVEWRRLLHPKTEEQEALADNYDLNQHLDILISVCNAVAFAHDKGLAHLDLKPENVMIGDYGEVLVMDWGLALDIRDPEATSEINHAPHKSTLKRPCGTPCYMPPELVEAAAKEIGPWTDVYLLGGILHEILTGEPPHRGDNLLQVLVAAALSETKKFSNEIPEELQKICNKALSKDVGKRFSSVKEFQESIKGYIKHTESLTISHRAKNLLGQCLSTLQKIELRTVGPSEIERNRLYADYAEAVAGFRQATLLWMKNEEAIDGEQSARTAFAETALKIGDLGLAEAQAAKIDFSTSQQSRLLKKITSAKEEKERANRVSKWLRKGITAALAFTFVVMSLALYFVSSARKKEERQRKNAEQLKERAEQQRIAAEQAEQRARDNEQAARVAQALERELKFAAQEAEQKAKRSELAAKAAQAQERKQRIAAQESETRAIASKIKARNSEEAVKAALVRERAQISAAKTAKQSEKFARDFAEREARWVSAFFDKSRKALSILIFEDRDYYRSTQDSKLLKMRKRALKHAFEQLDYLIKETRYRSNWIKEYKAEVLLQLGHIAIKNAKTEAAIEHYKKAGSIAADLAEERYSITRSNLPSQMGLNYYYNAVNSLVEVYNSQGQRNKVKKLYSVFFSLLRHYIRESPRESKPKEYLFYGITDLGNAFILQKDYNEAIKQFQKAIEVGQKIVTARPTNNIWKRNLAVIIHSVGSLLRSQGQFASARRHYNESLTIFRKLVAAEPKNVSFTRSISDVLFELGTMADKSEQAKHNPLLLDQIIEHYRKLVRQHPELQEEFNKVEHKVLSAKSALRIEELISGEATPKSSYDFLVLAFKHLKKKNYFTSFKNYKVALKNNRIRSDLVNGHLYNAACSAALAANEKDGEQSERLKAISLDWLKEDIEARRELLSRKSRRLNQTNLTTDEVIQIKRFKQLTLKHFEHALKKDPDLEAIRKMPAFEKLFK